MYNKLFGLIVNLYRVSFCSYFLFFLFYYYFFSDSKQFGCSFWVDTIKFVCNLLQNHKLGRRQHVELEEANGGANDRRVVLESELSRSRHVVLPISYLLFEASCNLINCASILFIVV